MNAPNSPQPPDPLGEILHLLRLTGTFYCQPNLTAPWGIAVPPLGDVLSFAVVMSGRCWLTMGGSDPVLVEQGSLVLLTDGTAHEFRSAPDEGAVPLDDLPVRKVTEIYETLEYGGGGALVSMMYGVVRFDHAAGNMLKDLLPPLLKVDTWNEDAGSWLHSTLRFIAREARDMRPGGETVITRLADVVVIEAIRRWIDTAPETDRGWLRGVRDPRVGRAIKAIHQTPEQDWTLDSLAATASMSRSAFAARFTDLVGFPAMQYVTQWRMHLARTRLLHSSEPIAGIAHDLGYQSEPAFCRAFKRVFGQPPGKIRRAALSD